MRRQRRPELAATSVRAVFPAGRGLFLASVRAVFLAGVAAAFLVGCSAPAPTSAPTPEPARTPAPTPTAAPVETLGSAAPGEVAIELRPAPANLGCDAMLPEYRSVSIRIDALADDQVWAVTDRGASLLTYWSAGFRGGTSLDPAVADAAGVIVARDGDVIVIPDGAWPRLGGYFVCPASSAIYVLLEDPA